MINKHVVLVANSNFGDQGAVPSGYMLEGIAYCAALCDQAGCIPHIVDLNTPEAVKVIAQEGHTGFKQWGTDKVHETISSTGAKLAICTLYANGLQDNFEMFGELNRRNPGLVTAAGGPQVSSFGRKILEHADAFDIVVPGRGENAFAALCDHVYKGEPVTSIPGAFYRGGKKRNKTKPIDFSELPFPIYDEAVYPDIRQKLPVASINLGAGCEKDYDVGPCKFCAHHLNSGNRQNRLVENALAEAEYDEKNGIYRLRVTDSNAPPEIVNPFLSGLGEGILASIFGYSNHKYDTFRNLLSIFLGVESLDPATLRKLNKTKDVEKYIRNFEEIMQEAERQGVIVIYANIVPVHDDTSARILADRDRVVQHNPHFFTALPIAPMPGSELYYEALRRGEDIGLLLDEDIDEKMMLDFKYNNLLPPNLQPPTLWQTRVDGKYVRDTFREITAPFTGHLIQNGILPASDETVLIAHAILGSLSKDKQECREQVSSTHKMMAEAIKTGDYQTLEEITAQAWKN